MRDPLKRMSSSLVIAGLLAVLAISSPLNGAHDDDFDFEVSGDFEIEFDGSSRRLWGNKEINAVVGKAFHLVVPKGSFSSNSRAFEAKRAGNKPLPPWLLFDKTGGVFWGVPFSDDIETVHVVVRSVDTDKNISEEFVINVVEAPTDLKETCLVGEDKTFLTLLIDRGVKAIKPKQRIIAINNIGKFFGLPFSAFTLKPQSEKDDITDSSVVLAGPGNLKSRISKLTSLLQVPVGCDGRLWLKSTTLIHQLKQQARDGTISEVIGLPLIGWRVRTETKPILRSKRQVEDYGSSGDYEDYYNYDEDEYGDEETSTKASTSTTTQTSQMHPHRHHHGEVIDFSIPVLREDLDLTSKVDKITTPMLPESSPALTTSTSTTTTTTTTSTTSTTPTTTTEKSTTISKATPTASNPDPFYDESDYDETEDYDNEDDDEAAESKTIVPNLAEPKTVVFETTPTTIAKPTEPTILVTDPRRETSPVAATSTEALTTLQIVEDTAPLEVFTIEVTTPVATTISTTPSTTSTSTIGSTARTTTTTTPPPPPPQPPTTIPTTTTKTTSTTTALTTTSTEKPTTEEETTFKSTTIRQAMSTPRSTTVRETIESIDYETKNFQPYIENRLQHLVVVAGKIFKFVIPKNTFKDFEDNYNLTIEFLNAEEEPIGKDSWCHFNPHIREIYGLPLEKDVSKWEYTIKATDREGASVTDRLTIQVQQHKLQHVVNHEFTLLIRIEKHQEFPHYVDWCLKTLRALGKIYNTNMSDITVRHVNYTSQPVIFTWTNDSVPTNDCPKTEIEDLFKVLIANVRGDPSRELNQALSPELRVTKVLYQGLSLCETPQIHVTPPTNFRPFLRNPVDHINATVGELLVFKVPDDTFFDPEDTFSRTLNITLLTANREAIPADNWLQFDAKNREFYGIPFKAGRSEYQLVCVDSAGLPATDSLEIVVHPPPKLVYNVDVSMTIQMAYSWFSKSALQQRKFVEKIQQLFGDRNTSNIHIEKYKADGDSTIISWTNKSLSGLKCQGSEIHRFETTMKTNDKMISYRVHSIMDPDFPVSKIMVVQKESCKPKKAIKEERIPVDEPTPEAASDEYLITFIVPAVIVSLMLFLAAVAACVLYRRRRTGKMNVEEDGRQTYGNKGIPVIFQEELEEKPESGTKAPVILKDEKPPLAPPEYSKSGSLKLNDDSEHQPYQPPPPFTRTQDNGRQQRPKPTPTYRKPPPYVPP